MNKSASLSNYEERLNRVTAYIYDHLDEEIDLLKLADIAHMSPYHWHRIYRAMRGETIATTVKRLRLHHAAEYLAQTPMTVAEIARRSGYKNLQSFTRIFSAAYGMPPAQYRKHGSHTRFQPNGQHEDTVMYDVAIKTVPTMKLVTVEHVGSYMQIGEAFETLFYKLGEKAAVDEAARVVGVFFDDIDVVPENELRSLAGVVVEGNAPLAPPLKAAEIAGGSYAVLRHKGPYADMKPAYEWFFGSWLVQSGREAANVPVFEEYLNNPRDTAPPELLTDIYLPLAATE